MSEASSHSVVSSAGDILASSAQTRGRAARRETRNNKRHDDEAIFSPAPATVDVAAG
jgi:hypothetical protein